MNRDFFTGNAMSSVADNSSTAAPVATVSPVATAAGAAKTAEKVLADALELK
jgi:hypothetical protein